jgi:hypothetical protein
MTETPSESGEGCADSPAETGGGCAVNPAENGGGFAGQRPAHELRGRSIAMGLIGPIAIRPRQFDALVGGRRGRRFWVRGAAGGEDEWCVQCPRRMRPLLERELDRTAQRDDAEGRGYGIERRPTPPPRQPSDEGRLLPRSRQPPRRTIGSLPPGGDGHRRTSGPFPNLVDKPRRTIRMLAQTCRLASMNDRIVA